MYGGGIDQGLGGNSDAPLEAAITKQASGARSGTALFARDAEFGWEEMAPIEPGIESCKNGQRNAGLQHHLTPWSPK